MPWNGSLNEIDLKEERGVGWEMHGLWPGEGHSERIECNNPAQAATEQKQEGNLRFCSEKGQLSLLQILEWGCSSVLCGCCGNDKPLLACFHMQASSSPQTGPTPFYYPSNADGQTQRATNFQPGQKENWVYSQHSLLPAGLTARSRYFSSSASLSTSQKASEVLYVDGVASEFRSPQTCQHHLFYYLTVLNSC